MINMSNELLEKVIDTTMLGSTGQGLLTASQGNRFLDYMFDSTVLGQDARTLRLRANSADIDRIHVGQRLVRVATEAVDDHVNVGATFSKISLTTTKLRLDWELSSESLEDGIEGEALEDHIARLMSTQMGNDLEDLAINGDASSPDPLLKAFDGWRKTAMLGGHVIDAAGATMTSAVFNSALKAMPRNYKQRRGQMKFYAGSNLIQDYLFWLSQNGPETVRDNMLANGGNQVEGPLGSSYGFAYGVPVQEVPLFDETRPGTYTGAGADGQHGVLELTFPQNRIWAVKRDIEVFREFKPKKDTIEYTVYTRVGVNIENLDAYVVVRNIAVSNG